MISNSQGLNWGEHQIFQQYLKDVSRYQLLDKQEERILIKLSAEGNKKAQDRLVKGNLRFVINVAMLYRGQGLTPLELINEGNIGLIEAAKRFDPSRNIKFISYAVWWIRQGITRAIADKARMVRISAEKELVLRRLNRTATSMRQIVGGSYVLDTEPLEKVCRYNGEQINDILLMGQRTASFDAPVGEDGDCALIDRFADDNETAEDQMSKSTRDQLIRKAIAQLPATNREVLERHFGLEGHQDSSLLTIARKMRMSKERVRQIKEASLQTLRDGRHAEELSLSH